MTPGTDKTAGGRGGDGEGLCGLAMDASARVGLPAIMARDRPDCPVIQQNWCLWTMESALESSGRPTAVVGRRPSGKSRLKEVPFVTVPYSPLFPIFCLLNAPHRIHSPQKIPRDDRGKKSIWEISVYCAGK